jgi:hypothetical protein
MHLKKEGDALRGESRFFLGKKAIGQLVEAAGGAVLSEECIHRGEKSGIVRPQGNGP